MIALLALSAALVPQLPGAAGGGEPSPGRDVVRLLTGAELAGRIVLETADYVEIELGPGTRVGLAKSRTTAIEHGVRPSGAEPAPAPAARFAPHDRWAVLHDALGEAVGWLHATITVDAAGGTRLSEEWRFTAGERTVETTVLEVLGPAGEPLQAFCHERIREPGDRLSGERIVHAVVADGRLLVTRRSGRGAERQGYEFPPGTRFPLELREELRARPAGTATTETHVVFDPVREDFAGRTYEVGRTRRVDRGGGTLAHVRILEASAAGGLRNTEWLDAGTTPLRTEVAGPALVAVPVSGEEEALRRAGAAGPAFPPALRTEAGGTFGLWLPNPAWRFADVEREGEVAAVADVDGAALTLVKMTQLDPTLELPSATDATLRWLRLAYDDLKVVDRRTTTVRGAELAERVRASAVRNDGRPVELLVHVLRRGEAWFASCGTAPRTAFARIEPELDWMVARFELCGAALTAGPPVRPGGRGR